ncbi:TadA family conjugal transfer-associated ATPase [Okibacterium fritillariae]|uniref:Pilus assembly protein CpaF n=1 Tax=Okibacterium fritillariae TaxID=123320 RepID=A0A1T5KDJ2_9MICO|nr:TadA family conjugal transfer-associated ATPase [Okibacterium fritillariae]SKC61756.1 pilus assembly protein CpaF [Okibacterium fritillariae]
MAPLRIDTASRFGNLGPYLLLDDVTDIVVTGSSGAWVDRGRGFERVTEWMPSPDVVHALAVRLIAEGGRHVDEVTPFVDVRLPGGIRVHAVLPPLSVGGAALSIRVPAQRPLRLADLEARGMFSLPGGAVARRLREAVSSRTNVLISGGAGTGKTTLLAALLSHADPAERIICVEDVSELLLDHPHVVSLEARQPNAEGSGGVDIARLLRESLRMRPDRLVLGECRGSEIRDMLGALNTGHEGGACTVHANSLDDVPARLEALGALAHMTAESVARQSASAIGLIVHLRRIDGVRRVSALGHLRRDEHGRLAVATEVAS